MLGIIVNHSIENNTKVNVTCVQTTNNDTVVRQPLITCFAEVPCAVLPDCQALTFVHS